MELINLSINRKKELREYILELIKNTSETKCRIKLPKNILETLIFNQKNGYYYPVWTHNLNMFDLSEIDFDNVRYTLPDLRTCDDRIIDFSNTNAIIKEFGIYDIYNIDFSNVNLSKTEPIAWYRIHNCIFVNTGLRIKDTYYSNQFDFNDMLKKSNLLGCYFENVLIDQNDYSLEGLREKNDKFLFESAKNELAKVLIKK